MEGMSEPNSPCGDATSSMLEPSVMGIEEFNIVVEQSDPPHHVPDRERWIPHRFHMGIEEINEEGASLEGSVTFSVEGSHTSPNVPEDDELDQEWQCSEASNYLKDSWPPQLLHSSCTIVQVPNYMKRCDYEAYAPTVVTIGPFRFKGGKWRSLQLLKHKSHCVSYLLARHGSDEKAAELLEKCMKLVLQLETPARSCYLEDFKHVHKHKFAEMLLQDGCFILRLLLKQKKEKPKKEESQEINDTDLTSKLKRWESELTVAPMVGRLWFWNQVVYDLLKLENQIPFFVVQSLFDLLKTPADEGIDLVELALELLSGIYPRRAKTFEPPLSSYVLHLLHLFHSSLIPPKLENTTETEGADRDPSTTVTEAPDRDPGTMVIEAPDWIPSATVLRHVGIKIRPPRRCFFDVTSEYGVTEVMIQCPKRRTTKKVESFLDVTFQNGMMEIPPFQVDDYTSMVFRNLIAFEQCYLKTGVEGALLTKTTTHITTYARFMNDLINTTKDVRLLSLNGVLLNRLGSEEVVADLLNKICDRVHHISERNYLRKVISDVTKYYKAPCRPAVFRKCSRNSCAISFLVGVVLLLVKLVFHT